MQKESIPIGLKVEELTTLGELSKNDKKELCVIKGGYCDNLHAINFDQVKESWYDEKLWHQVKSCDALYIHGGIFYLIEFKTGDFANIDRHRKIYDSVIGLLEHNLLSLDECRRRVQYVMVEKKLEPSSAHLELQQYLERGQSEPWEYEISRSLLNQWQQKPDIRKLTNFLFHKAYALSPTDFDAFARNRSWSD